MYRVHFSMQFAICMLILLFCNQVPSDAAGTIAFVRNGDIYTIDMDGTRLHRLTTDGRNGLPLWSPDGRLIAFAKSGISMQSGCLWVISLDGKYKHRITKDERYNSIYPVAWLPDMSGLLVSRHYHESDALPVLTVVTLDGKPFRYLSRWMQASGKAGFLQQFPDTRYFAIGKAGAFTRNGDLIFTAATEWVQDGARLDLYTMHMDRNGLHRLAVEPRWRIACLSANPVNGTILTSDDPVRVGQSASAKLRDASGNILREIAAIRQASRHGVDWSPDGKYIIYQVMDSAYPRYEDFGEFKEISKHSSIWIMKADGTARKRFLRNACHPNWRKGF